MRWSIAEDGIHLQVSRQELSLFNNGLNEALALLEERVFPTRMGGSQQEARALLLELRSLRAALDPELATLLREHDAGTGEL